MNDLSLSEKLEKYIYENGISKQDTLNILNTLCTFGGLQSVKQNAELTNTSLQNIYQNKETFSKFGIKLVIDNE